MPVTAKLSKQFYDRFGEAVTNELVDWFNQVDASYKSDMREMNELHYGRFEARLDQTFAEIRVELAEFRGEMRGELAEFRGEMRGELADVRGEIRGGFADVRGEMRSELADLRGEMRSELADLRGETRGGLAEFRGEMRSALAALDTKLERGLRDQTRFLVGAWGVLLAAIIALSFRR